MSCKPRHLNKFQSFLNVSVGGALSFAALCVYRGDENFYSKILMPFVTKYIDPEFAHDTCIFLTQCKLIRCPNRLTEEQEAKLNTKVLGMSFKNPIGIAAGFDKNSYAAPGLKYYGLGFSEVGTVTPKPQPGNPKRRIFRIAEDKAIINRCGFNNDGIEEVVANLSRFTNFEPMLLGLNLGKNRQTKDLTKDYLTGLEKSYKLGIVDYFVINISSPNTPGLRDTQSKENLDRLLDVILSKMETLSVKKPLLIKIAPDLDDTQIRDIADLVMKKKCGNSKVSGVILTNTTISRPSGDKSQVYNENGGLSGAPLKDMSTKVIREFYKVTKGQVPIIGVGGVSSGADAYEKIRAGASLIQIYTSLTFDGPPVVNKIKRELVELLEKDKLNSISEAVGLDHKT